MIEQAAQRINLSERSARHDVEQRNSQEEN